MKRIGGTFFALLFLVWGLATIVGGAGEGRIDWVMLGAVLAGFGCVFIPSVLYLWRGDGV